MEGKANTNTHKGTCVHIHPFLTHPYGLFFFFFMNSLSEKLAEITQKIEKLLLKIVSVVKIILSSLNIDTLSLRQPVYISALVSLPGAHVTCFLQE